MSEPFSFCCAGLCCWFQNTRCWVWYAEALTLGRRVLRVPAVSSSGCCFFSPGCTRTVLLPECSRLLCSASGEYPGQPISCLALLLWLLLFVLLRVPSPFGCSFFLSCASLNSATTPCCNLVLVNEINCC